MALGTEPFGWQDMSVCLHPGYGEVRGQDDFSKENECALAERRWHLDRPKSGRGGAGGGEGAGG